MEKDEKLIRELLEKGLLTKAPDSFTDKVMMTIAETETQEGIIEYCKEKLATYKLPTLIEFRSELPKTNVGKVLKKDLRKEELAKSSVDAE